MACEAHSGLYSHGCPQLTDNGFTTVRWRSGWRRCLCRRNNAESVVIGDVKIFRPRDPTWKRIIRKLKRFVGIEQLDRSLKGYGNVSTAAVWPLRVTQPCRALVPRVCIRQRRNVGPVSPLDIPIVRTFVSKTYEL